MEMYMILLSVTIILTVLFITLYSSNNKYIKIINKEDNKYEKLLKEYKIVSRLLNNNKVVNNQIINNNLNILFVTYDDRSKEEYVQIHNNNILDYCKKYGYNYKFYDKKEINLNNYWYKIYLVLKELENNNNYDYVIWLDSDTIILDYTVDIKDIINSYNSDIFVVDDNISVHENINAGIFIIKNSGTGKQFLKDCLNSLKPMCIRKDNSLNGKWARTCYEQGIMNKIIIEKYDKYTTVLPKNIVYCSQHICIEDVFIHHLYARKAQDRKVIFNYMLKNKIKI